MKYAKREVPSFKAEIGQEVSIIHPTNRSLVQGWGTVVRVVSKGAVGAVVIIKIAQWFAGG